MKNIKLTFVAIATIAPLTGCASPSALIKVRVIDEDGKPINNVTSELINIYDYGTIVKGLTDKNGYYSDYKKNIFEVSGYFEKAGYYESRGIIWEAPTKWGDLPPANTNFIITLKKIISPVPMTRRVVRTFLPRANEPIGFDMQKGDWIAPDGKGTYADVYFTGSFKYETRRNHELSVSSIFTNQFNGIQPFIASKISNNKKITSRLLPQHFAPETGFKPEIKLWQFNDPARRFQRHTLENRNYYFRVRTQIDEKGKIISANYGWIDGEIIVDISNNQRIILHFDYYYNPDSQSRSLEPKEIADKQTKDLPKGEN